MKTIKRFAILSVIFALCCVFTFSSINLSSVKVNATETEIQDVEEEKQEETIIDEEQVEEPVFEEEKLQELTDWIVALIVSFLGSGAFYGIFRAILNGTIKTLKAKLVELEEKNKISSESKLAYEEKINNLEYKLDEYLGQNQVLLDYIQTKIKVDEEKVKKTNELLEQLMPKQQTEEGE